MTGQASRPEGEARDGAGSSRDARWQASGWNRRAVGAVLGGLSLLAAALGLVRFVHPTPPQTLETLGMEQDPAGHLQVVLRLNNHDRSEFRYLARSNGLPAVWAFPLEVGAVAGIDPLVDLDMTSTSTASLAGRSSVVFTQSIPDGIIRFQMELPLVPATRSPASRWVRTLGRWAPFLLKWFPPGPFDLRTEELTRREGAAPHPPPGPSGQTL